MARKPTVPTPLPHDPTGDFTPPPREEGLVCSCGATLTRVSNGASDPRYLDWTEVDEQGKSWTDVTPTFRYRKPDGEIIVIDMHDADAWDRLAKVDIGRYSIMSAAYGGGMLRFTHVHRAAGQIGHTPACVVDPPQCHGKWMWAAPDGWRCRTTYGEPALRAYTEPTEAVA